MDMNDVRAANITQDTWRNRIALRSPIRNPDDFDPVHGLIRPQRICPRIRLRTEHAIQRYDAYREAALYLPLRKLSDDVFETSDGGCKLSNDMYDQHVPFRSSEQLGNSGHLRAPG